ncbi:MAG: diaminopimelate epimerase [Sedimenticola sp.]
MNQNFVKYSALGNDYIVIDPNTSNISIDHDAIIKICDRHNGPGSDGILYGPESKDHLSLKIFNPDGSECDKSGNGLIIFAHYLYDNGCVGHTNFDIHLKDESVSIQPIDPDNGLFKVRMGKGKPAQLDDRKQPYPYLGYATTFADTTLVGSFISIGNPHIVLETDAPTVELAQSLGPIVSNHPMFQNRTNVQFCKILSRHEIQIEIYERGAGYTLASGSSSCAAVTALYLQGKVDAKVKVNMPGGVLDIEIDAELQTHLIGSSKIIYSGELT